MIWGPVVLNGRQCPHRDLGCSLVVFWCKNSISSSFFNWILLDTMKYRLHGESWYFVLGQTLLLASLFPFQLALHKWIHSKWQSWGSSNPFMCIWWPSGSTIGLSLCSNGIYFFSVCIISTHVYWVLGIQRVFFLAPIQSTFLSMGPCKKLFINKSYISSHENWNFNDEFPPNPTFLNYTSI